MRPLNWEFPADQKSNNITDEWMFGDELLVAPVLAEGQAHRSHIYIPPGSWIDYSRGNKYEGPKTIVYSLDPDTWADISLFDRAGAILPTQKIDQHVGERAITKITIEAFPTNDDTTVDYYDDDGVTYAYERGAFYNQHFSLVSGGAGVRFEASSPTGTFAPSLKGFQLRLHGINAQTVSINDGPC